MLKSLPENARGLYRILVAEILATAEDDGALGGGFGADDNTAFDTMDGGYGSGEYGVVKARTKVTKGELPGVDAKIIYAKAVEEFYCSSEMMFWSLLKEFVDHRMVVIMRERGAQGGEMLGVEMEKAELEGVLEDLIE